jgi:hypothetical protein
VLRGNRAGGISALSDQPLARAQPPYHPALLESLRAAVVPVERFVYTDRAANE